MIRSAKINLKFNTTSKLSQISALLSRYRSAVNFFIEEVWDNGGSLDKQTLAKLQNSQLSERFKSQALKHAVDICKATKESSKALNNIPSKPKFSGAAKLDAKFLEIKDITNVNFDLCLRLSCLQKGKKLNLVAKKTKVFNKWSDFIDSKLIQGCFLSETSIVLFFEIPDSVNKYGKTKAIDIGINHVLTTSDKEFLGSGFKRKILTKIKRKKKGSKSAKRAYAERENYLNRTVKSLDLKGVKTLGIEKLVNLKKGKKKTRSKSFRKAVSGWTYRHVINRIKQYAQENRVLLVEVNPANTSRICPECNHLSKDNRKGEKFRCVLCGYEEQADYVAARNILVRTEGYLQESRVPVAKKDICV